MHLCIASAKCDQQCLINLIIIKKGRMFRVFRRMQPLSILKPEKARTWSERVTKYAVMPVIFTSSLYYYKMKEVPITFLQEGDLVEYKDPETNKIKKFVSYCLRFLELSFIFAPSVVLLPLCLFESTRQFWLNVFLSAIKRAGFVWIKAFQYLSHRRDIIGQEMAEKFVILRQNSPQHTLKHTEQIIKRVYGKQINQMFQEFDRVPIASGSVSQVYKAKLNQKIVAVKVRHPDIGSNLSKDIDLMFMFSNFFSIFSKKFEIPITTESLKKILGQQLYFLQQKKNIDNFNKINIDNNVKFPQTYPESTDEVLIQEYIDGKTIGFYENNTHNMNRLIANIGAKAFFSMLMKYNFVHADCHAGNILVRIKQTPNAITDYAYSLANRVTSYFLAKFIKYGMNSDFLRRLSQQNYQYEKGVQELIKRYKKRVQIVLIDVGMAIKLTKEKKKSFQSFLQEIIKGDAVQCAKWIYRISQYNGKMLEQGENMKYLTALETMFQRVHKTSLDSLEGIVVLKEMLGVIRQYDMKIDGQISILLTNMLILEAIAKDLDPSINILRCAVPYLRYK